MPRDDDYDEEKNHIRNFVDHDDDSTSFGKNHYPPLDFSFFFLLLLL